ncbi:MAG: DUF1641 domain-containing protein [Gemmatimonadetes bacterium]|nr:DUF1641 domain-containing protein [Gemmatimonadota bacterium]
MLNTNETGGDVAVGPDVDLAISLAEINRKLDAVVDVTEDLARQLESFEDLREDLVPIAHEGMLIAYRKLNELEQAGVIDFLKESAGVFHTISTSFTQEDVRALGENVVHMLRTVRNLTQPEVLELADKAALGLKEAPIEPLGRIGLLRSFRDPEVRKGLTMFLGVLREMGSDSDANDNS